MNLIDENVERESEEKQKKLTKIIIITIAVLIGIVAIILIYSSVKKKNTLTLSINGADTKFSQDLFLMQDKKNVYVSDKGQIYISVKKLASMLGVGFYNDEQKVHGEDTTKCHVKTENEYTSFISGSNTMYKTINNKADEDDENSENKNSKKNNSSSNNKDEIKDIEKNDFDYEYFTVEDGVRLVDNEIYASTDAIELGFNVIVSYNQKNKAVSIYTLDALQKTASSIVPTAVNDETLSYNNKKLLKYGYVLIKNSADDYGIANYNNYQEGNYVLSCKYSDIYFVESYSCLIVTTSDDEKQGVLKFELNGSGNVKTVIEPKYSSIHQLGDDGTLYIIKENERYGIIKISEKDSEIKSETILKPEYQYVGIEDDTKYEYMNSKFIIDDKYIPIKRDNKWGIVSTEGKMLIVPQYDYIGCATAESGNPVIYLPDLTAGDGVVFGNNIQNIDPVTNQPVTTSNDEKNIKYYIVSLKNSEKIGMESDEIYSVSENEEKKYFMKVKLSSGDPYRFNIYTMYGDSTKKSNNNSNGKTTQQNGNTTSDGNSTNNTNTSNNVQSNSTNVVNTNVQANNN